MCYGWRVMLSASAPSYDSTSFNSSWNSVLIITSVSQTSNCFFLPLVNVFQYLSLVLFLFSFLAFEDKTKANVVYWQTDSFCFGLKKVLGYSIVCTIFPNRRDMSYLSPSKPCQIFHLQLKHFFLLPFFIAGNFICLPSTVFVQRRGGDMTDLSQEKKSQQPTTKAWK